MCESTTSSPRGVFPATVLANESLCSEHFLLRLGLETFPECRPGQFVQVQCRPVSEQLGAQELAWPPDAPPKFTQPELLGLEPLLRRPFSLAGRRDLPDGVELDLILRAVGVGSGWLQSVRPGATLSLLGPLGNAFPIHEDKPNAALVGGGVGIPPMLYLARGLRQAGKTTTAFCGVRSEHLLPLRPGKMPIDPAGRPALCTAEFDAADTPVVIATDDGTVGRQGLVTDVLLHWLHETRIARDTLVVYSCGPEPMMRAVGELCGELGIVCYLSLERNMACGMGTCQSCVVKIRDEAAEADWRYKLCCSDGPVFSAESVIWE